jgi:hypothetical protein
MVTQMHMLDYEAPGLAAQLEALSLENRRLALGKAAAILSKQISDFEPRMHQLLEVALQENALSAEQVDEVKAYADSADTQHFVLEEQGAAQSISGNWFAKARLAMAIANSFGGVSWQDAADAAYELFFTLDDKSAAIALVRAQVEALLTANRATGAQ